MPLESSSLHLATALYAAAALMAVGGALTGRNWHKQTMLLVGAALSSHAIAIGLRWDRLDHGPYVNMFEVLSSNVWSLHAALLVTVLLLPRLRDLLATALPLLQVLLWWMLTTDTADTTFPVTYDTVWLPVHVWLGKLFLGIVVVAVAGSLVILLRRFKGAVFPRLPASPVLDEVNFRLVLLAFVFECLMLIAGAVWAQDAWGRYWDWDPLETWSFLTWLMVAFYLHLRVTRRPSPPVAALLVVGIFVVAFATFFGMPFISTAPHKGMI